MTDQAQYFEYMQGRTFLAVLYRRNVLYPRLAKRIVGRLLDVGCGLGDMLAFRRNSVGADINGRAVDFCRRRGLEAYLMESGRLPFDDESFGSVLMDNVLEHIEDPVSMLTDVRRILPPQGRLLIGVPGSRGWDCDPDHKVRYDEDSLVAYGESNGFR
ncbi:MAG: class I SAM-dependent methyltransferase, partial [Caldimonas sp.]